MPPKLAKLPTREVPAVSCEVKYHGFVYVNGGEGIIPGTDKIKEGAALLKKPKKARKAHPLFARGFDTTLTLRCSEQGLKVFVRTEEGQNMVVMDHLVHKIAFVMNQGKSVLFVAKRRLDSINDQFKCHGFETHSSSTAKQLATHIVTTCNSVFRKLRRTRKQIRKRTEKEGKTAPAVAPAGGPSSEEAARLRAELQAEVEAAKSYRESLALALSELDEEEDDDEEEGGLTEAQLREMDEGLAIQYEEFADEFAQMSMEIHQAKAEAEIEAQGSGRRVLNLGVEGDAVEVDDDGEYDYTGGEVGEVNFDTDEYLVSRTQTI